MGCDGGTIPRRDELVRVKKKPEAKDKDSELAFQWRHCFLTQLLLQEPIVMCGMGHLYSKLPLIEALLNRDSLPDSVRHIKSLKDVRNLNLTPNPEFVSGDDKKDGSVDTRGAPYICPVIGLEMSGKFRFVALWTCGCVFSERALKEISTSTCHKCLMPFTEDDVVVLNGTEEDMVLMRSRIELRKQKNKKDKEKKKEIKKEIEATKCEETEPAKNSVTNAGKSSANENVEKPKVVAATLKRPRNLINDESTKKMKACYSVAKDPNASDVYKSLFTSHKSENEQQRAHWITYNPFYN
ncbi:protein RTF2 homolog [Agrilus planipennis]|uniref:Replication termination factor 2 n=1 Tax=Agrilus planipennis TaxID=224129 RepID=A0A1W4WWE4_AGRPL|nr:protein RTF2 homolog [Agrilus planipennis]